MRPAVESEVPFGKTSRDWVMAWRVIVALLAAIAAAGGGVLLFAGKAYVKDAAAETLAPFSALPTKVSSLTEFQVRQERANDKTDARLDSVVQAVTALKASTDANLTAQNLATSRIVDQLDRIERRQARPSSP